MYDFQNTVLLSARPTKGTLILRNVALLLVALTLLGCIWINMFSFAPLFIAAMAFWWWGTFRTGLEYEYTYFDGDLDPFTTYTRIPGRRLWMSAAASRTGRCMRSFTRMQG